MIVLVIIGVVLDWNVGLLYFVISDCVVLIFGIIFFLIFGIDYLEILVFVVKCY